MNWYETTASGSTIAGGTAFNYFGWISGYLGRWEEAATEFGRDEVGFQAAIQASIDQLGPGAGELDNPNFKISVTFMMKS